MNIMDKFEAGAEETKVPMYALVLVIVSAVVVGASASFIIWWFCCYKSGSKDKEKSRLFRKAPVRKQKGKSPVLMEPHEFIEKFPGQNDPRPPLSPLLRGRNLFNLQTQPSGTTIYIQPKTEPLTSIASSTVSDPDPDLRARKLDLRYKEGKVAKMTLSTYYDDRSSELVISVLEVRSIHHSVSCDNAFVEMRRENGKSSSKLIPVRLICKSGKLKGAGNEYKFPMSVDEILHSKFNFYLWSTDNFSRPYQAGNCMFTFENKELEAFTQGNGFTTTGDFTISDTEDTSDCAVISMMLRYINRSGKLVCIIYSISNVPKLGWRSVASTVFDKGLPEPSPVVKVILSRDGTDIKTLRTEAVKGYNPKYDSRFVFDVPLQELRRVKITLEVSYTNMKVTQNKLGTLEFSDESTGSEGEHWREMEQSISKDTGVRKDHVIRNRPRRAS